MRARQSSLSKGCLAPRMAGIEWQEASVIYHQDPEVKTELLSRLRKKYLTDKPTPHLTELLYCLTRSWSDRFEPIASTDHELILWCIGFGLEEVLLRDSSRDAALKSVERDGVWLTPDYVAGREMVDLKSTRMYFNSAGVPSKGWPEGWIQQFMAYAAQAGRTRYAVAVVALGQANLFTGTFQFTQEELDNNWLYILGRRDAYNVFTSKRVKPQPFMWNKEWECEYCRYYLKCSVDRNKESAR